MKKYLTHKEMIEFLKENKKIIIPDEYSEIFSERNYVSIINPFKDLFSYGKKKDGSYYYKDPIQITDIVNLVILDDKFSNTMYSYIGMFERKLKEQVINNCCQLYVEIGDLTCTSCSQEIRDVIDKKRVTPTFAPNLY